MELEWLVDNSDKVVGDRRRIIPIIFIWHRWIKKASEPQRLCFSFSLWSDFCWPKQQIHFVTNLELGEAVASLSLTHKENRSFGKISGWEWTVGIMLREVGGWISMAKEMMTRVGTSKMLVSWRRRNNKFTASTINSEFAFDF
jgi:hypothetical protein